MPRTLPTEYTDALTAPTRRPMANVYVWHGDPTPVELDITADVQSISVTLTEEHQPGQATISVANPLGRYDPIGGGALADAFTEDNKVVVKLGYNGSTHTTFTGKIAAARMHYRRGDAEAIELTCFDVGKRFWKQQITSILYEDMQVNAIVTDLFTTYGGMDVGDISLAALDYVVAQVQFIQENLMDAGMMCLQPKMFRLYFDHAGILRSRTATAPESSSWDYSGAFVTFLDYDWADPVVDRVTVAGRTLSPAEIVGAEELMANVHADMIRGRSWEDITFWWDSPPSGADQTNIWTEGIVYGQCRVEKQPSDPHGDDFWDRVKGPRYFDGGVAWKFPPSNDALLSAHFYGVPSTWETGRVQGLAWDPVLSARYGDVPDEIDNPLIQSDADAAFLAEETLRISKWYRYKPRIRVPQNLAHEPGDLITVENPRTGRIHELYIRSLTHKFQRGSECSTELDCLLVT